MTTPTRSIDMTNRSHMTIVRWLAVLAFGTSLTGQFIIFGVPLFLRDSGAPSELIALFFLVALPYLGRFLWAPLIDRFGIASIGHYRSWILIMQALLCLLLAALAALDILQAPAASIAILVAVAVAVGTQQMCIDALTVRSIHEPGMPKAVSLQRAGSALAGFSLGGGLLYGLGDFGWAVVVSALLAVQLVILFAVMLVASLDQTASAPRPGTIYSFRHQIGMFLRPAIGWILAIGLLTTLASDLPYTMKSILLSDAGLSVAHAGLVGVLLANLCGLAMVFLVRPFIETIGGYRVMAGIGVLGITLGLMFLGVRNALDPVWAVAGFVVISGSLVFGASVAVASLLYPRVDREHAASEVATFQAFAGILLLVINSIATGALDSIGLPPLLWAGFACSALGSLFAIFRYRITSRTDSEIAESRA